MDIISNDSIGRSHISLDGLHLNKSGVSQLAGNFIQAIQSLPRMDFHTQRNQTVK